MSHRPLIDGKLCPYCLEKTKVISRWLGIPTWRKCRCCGRAWSTGA